MSEHRTLAEVLAEHQFRVPKVGLDVGCTCGWATPWDKPLHQALDDHAAHLAAVVAEWLTSEQAVEIVAQVQSDAYWSKGSPKTWPEYARLALAALAAHVKGEAS